MIFLIINGDFGKKLVKNDDRIRFQQCMANLIWVRCESVAVLFKMKEKNISEMLRK